MRGKYKGEHASPAIEVTAVLALPRRCAASLRLAGRCPFFSGSPTRLSKIFYLPE